MESLSLTVESPEATADIARAVAGRLAAGDVLLLDGPIGAGKTHFARALIRHLMEQSGAVEDVPSPTFTLVQTYELTPVEVWHADLYRLSDPTEVIELGLEEAFDTAICLIEWPDRLFDLAPQGALWVRFSALDAENTRRLEFSSENAEWLDRIAPVLEAA